MNPVRYWINEITAAKKREKDFRVDGQKIIDKCEGEKKDQTPFNILFSNTETLLPALYSATPRPVVQRRFKDDDPIGKAAAHAGERVLSFLLDTNIDGYETFDEAMSAATYDALLPGRGVTTIKYDSEEDEIPPDKEGDEGTPYKESELVCTDTTSWDRVYFGYAKKWSRVPWVAFEMEVDKEEATRLFGATVANKLVYSTPEKEEEEGRKEDGDQGERKVCVIYQIWDKDGGKKIRYVAEQYKEDFLKVADDTLELTGFYPCPRPLQFIERTNNLVPVAPYKLYENQAEELNELTRRIKRITRAIKARGVYDSELGEDLKTLMEADDNDLVPADKTASIAAEGGLQNAIWFMPVDKLIVVLRELYQAREACKQVIFEIMGLADIMRGASQASETLGAQEIKQTWGSLKLKRKQKEVQRYARDLLRMMLEVAAKKFSEDTWAKMTGLPFLTQQKVMELTQVSQAMQGQMAQMQMSMQQMPMQQGPDGQPQMPPQMMQMQQQMQEVQAQLQTPKWSDILQTLNDDLQRAYRIDIETNSTVEPEAVEDQKNIADVMNALGQFLNGVSPLVVQGIMPFQAAQSMMLAIVRRYRFGDEIEDYVKQMKPPQAPDAGKQQAEQQMAQQQHDMEMQKAQQDIQARQQENQQKAQIAERQAALDMERMQRESEYAAAEHQFKMEELASKRSLNAVVTASKLRIAEATAAQKEKMAKQPTA